MKFLNFYCFTTSLCLIFTLYGANGYKWTYLLQYAIVFINFYCLTALLCLTITLYGVKWKYILQCVIVFMNFLKSDTNSVWNMEALKGSEGQLYPYPGKVKSYVWAHFGFQKSMKDGKLDQILILRKLKLYSVGQQLSIVRQEKRSGYKVIKISHYIHGVNSLEMFSQDS